MKITLTADQVEAIVRAHVAAQLPGVHIYYGSADIQDSGEYSPPYFVGYSFSFAAIQTKFQYVTEVIAGMSRRDKIAAIKEVRELSRGFTPEEYKAFPVQLKDTYGHSVERYEFQAGKCFGLAYSKALVETIWAANSEVPF